MNPNGNLEQILESAVVISCEDLMRSTHTGLIHIEYGFAAGGTLDYLKVWSSLTRGHWLLACEYWMSANTFHGAGVSFSNGYQSEGLVRILELLMQHQNSFVLPEPRPAGIDPDFNAYGRRKRSGRSTDKRSRGPTGFIARVREKGSPRNSLFHGC